MSIALYYIIFMFQGFCNLIFRTMNLGGNGNAGTYMSPSFGYIVLAVMLIGMIIKTVVFLPRGAKIDLYNTEEKLKSRYKNRGND